MARDVSISREGSSQVVHTMHELGSQTSTTHSFVGWNSAMERTDAFRGFLGLFNTTNVIHHALVERVLTGQTTWRAVYSGEDDHWTAVEHRERFGRELSEGVEQLVREDDELAELLHDLQRRTRDGRPDD